jgi:hypothetical protein
MVPPPALHGELVDFLLGLRAVVDRARATLAPDGPVDEAAEGPGVDDDFLDLVLGLASFQRKADRLLALFARGTPRAAEAQRPTPSSIAWILR